MKHFILPRVLYDPSYENLPLPKFSGTHFTARVCFGVTTNKAQGLSFGGAPEYDLRQKFFEHGLLYVTLLTVTHQSKIAVRPIDYNRLITKVGYTSVLSKA